MANAPTMPARRSPPASSPPQQSANRFAVTAGIIRNAAKVGIYGPEGAGKSSLAALCPGVVFADLEHSTLDLDVSRVQGIVVPTVASNDANKAIIEAYAASWANLRAWVQSLTGGVYAIDSMTRAEDWAAAHVIRTKKSNEGAAASDSIEDFKYKAGLQFVTDEFRRLLGDIDNAFLRGASFIMIAHNRITKFKNPDGSDYIRHEPNLIDDPKTSNMRQWTQFCDHVLFIDQDVNATKGKATGGGSRCLRFDMSPTRISKTRSLPLDRSGEELVKDDAWVWEALGFKK